jgi:hypothetical protein
VSRDPIHALNSLPVDVVRSFVYGYPAKKEEPKTVNLSELWEYLRALGKIALHFGAAFAIAAFLWIAVCLATIQFGGCR